MLQYGDVCQWVAVDDDQVRQLACADGAGLLTQAHGLGAVFGGPANDIEWRDADVVHVECQLLSVAAVVETDSAVVIANSSREIAQSLPCPRVA